MAVAVYVASLTNDDTGRVVAVVVIQPSELTAFRVEVAFADEGTDERNLHHVQAALQRFSADFVEALRPPLKIVRKPAAKE